MTYLVATKVDTGSTTTTTVKPCNEATETIAFIISTISLKGSHTNARTLKTLNRALF